MTELRRWWILLFNTFVSDPPPRSGLSEALNERLLFDGSKSPPEPRPYP